MKVTAVTTFSVVVVLSCVVKNLPGAVTAAKRSPKTRRHDCPLWLAPSNLNVVVDDDNNRPTKYGLYAGRDYDQNSTLPFPELVIPVVDMFGEHHRTDANILAFLENVLWAQGFAGAKWEGKLSTPALIPGVGTLSLYHATFSNVHFLQAAVLKREPMIGDGTVFPRSGRAHLARGAITPYYNATVQATERIPAGMELFADFGCTWIGDGSVTTTKRGWVSCCSPLTFFSTLPPSSCFPTQQPIGTATSPRMSIRTRSIVMTMKSRIGWWMP